jgi:UDP-2-acetamido-3-amino-2,3-dideoxy-glucuronate N-acetyltransferase
MMHEHILNGQIFHVHGTATLEPGAIIGAGTKIWHGAHIRSGARIGPNCVIGKDVYVDNTYIGQGCKIQNGVSIYKGVMLDDFVFVGPNVTFTNDLTPRAISDWTPVETIICQHASIGAGSVIVAGCTINRFAMVAAGSVVTHEVPPHALVRGNPARLVGYVCERGHTMTSKMWAQWECDKCKSSLILGAKYMHEDSGDR